MVCCIMLFEDKKDENTDRQMKHLKLFMETNFLLFMYSGFSDPLDLTLLFSGYSQVMKILRYV